MFDLDQLLFRLKNPPELLASEQCCGAIVLRLASVLVGRLQLIIAHCREFGGDLGLRRSKHMAEEPARRDARGIGCDEAGHATAQMIASASHGSAASIATTATTSR